MTPRQAAEHRKTLESICRTAGMKQDSWGNWQFPGCPVFRIKFKKINVRAERKSGSTWLSTNFSKVMSQLTTEEFQQYINLKKAHAERVTATSDGQANLLPKKTVRDLYKDLRQLESKGIRLLRTLLEKYLGQENPTLSQIHCMQDKVKNLLTDYDQILVELKSKGVELEKF